MYERNSLSISPGSMQVNAPVSRRSPDASATLKHGCHHHHRLTKYTGEPHCHYREILTRPGSYRVQASLSDIIQPFCQAIFSFVVSLNPCGVRSTPAQKKKLHGLLRTWDGEQGDEQDKKRLRTWSPGLVLLCVELGGKRIPLFFFFWRRPLRDTRHQVCTRPVSVLGWKGRG